jgi:hypothetical protein
MRHAAKGKFGIALILTLGMAGSVKFAAPPKDGCFTCEEMLRQQ